MLIRASTLDKEVLQFKIFECVGRTKTDTWRLKITLLPQDLVCTSELVSNTWGKKWGPTVRAVKSRGCTGVAPD